MKHIIIYIILFFSLKSIAQTEDFANVQIKNINYIYKSSIKTVEVRNSAIAPSDAVLDIASANKLLIAFDDLDLNHKNYNYTFIHCDASWQQDRLLPNDYLQGFTDDAIRNFKYSINTTQSYVHYQVLFPNENMQLTKTGNYLLKVYEDFNPEKIIFTYRIMVYDSKIRINPTIVRSAIVQKRATHQQINFSINYSGTNITNPFSDLKVFVLKNADWNDALKDLKPTFIEQNGCIYNTAVGNIIAAGNECREFDTRDLRINTAFIKTISFDTGRYNIHLLPEQMRAKRYSFKGDIDGRFLIDNKNGTDPNTDADYGHVKFTLPSAFPLDSGDIFIYGQLSNYTYDSQFKLRYDALNAMYTNTLYFKQGFYNYEYRFIPYTNIKEEVEPKVIRDKVDGNFFETENTYYILIYAQVQGQYYDQLIGFTTIQSNN